MRYQDQVVRSTQMSVETISTAALAVPEDKRDWAPGGKSRSTLSQMREIATQAELFLPMIAERRVPAFEDHPRSQSKKLRESYASVEDCIEAIRESHSRLCQAIASFPDSDLEHEMTMPWGTVLTMADVLGLPRWNLTYHVGQINQIQLMLGDEQMH